MMALIKIKHCAIGLIILILGIGNAFAQQIKVYSSPDSVSIGDIVTYTLVLSQSLNYDSIKLPDSTSFGTNFEFLSRKQFKTSSAADSIIYELQFFGTENAEIKGLNITLTSGDIASVVAIPDIILTFKTLLAAQEEQELRPLKDIYDFRINWIPYILLLIILIISVWVVARYITKYRDALKNKEIVEVQLFKNPLDHLEVSLLALRSDQMLLERNFKPFFTKLGDLLREYIETVHNVDALEMTTRELVREMERTMIDPDLTRQISIVLRRADMVKFAKLEPDVEEALESIRDAERFVQIARQTDIQKVIKMQTQFELEQQERIKEQQKAQTIGNDLNSDPSLDESGKEV